MGNFREFELFEKIIQKSHVADISLGEMIVFPPKHRCSIAPFYLRIVIIVEVVDSHDRIPPRQELAREEGINFLAAGHYRTEVWGVRALAKLLGKKFGVHAEFIDVPNEA